MRWEGEGGRWGGGGVEEESRVRRRGVGPSGEGGRMVEAVGGKEKAWWWCGWGGEGSRVTSARGYMDGRGGVSVAWGGMLLLDKGCVEGCVLLWKRE